MLTNVYIVAAAILVNMVGLIFPSWNLPQGYYDGITWLGTQIGYGAAFLPDGTLGAINGALAFLLPVNLFVLIWLLAKNFRLPVNLRSLIFGKE